MNDPAGPSRDAALDAILQRVAVLGRLGPPSGEGPAAVSESLREVATRIEEVTSYATDASARLSRLRAVLKVRKARVRLAMDETMRDDPFVKFVRNQRTKESRARAAHAGLFREIETYETAIGDLEAVHSACKGALDSLSAARSTLQTRANLLIVERQARGPYG